ncbi:aspartate 1-decarboxylase [Streptomyces albireticuli]|uniref:Aspartate 1-decarboxylase n=1 Tax=Streptomyces albireticuli TaxID=1940 RepID=A0A2A2DH54_9ACTN|nr:aspartate 1-decarboxylase [Streptomyces albireticuli]MCD9142791.1 aspartate 1-decarboxylase [Streptomyces albireticuli]MCD9162890.1 aspartate 1-decarboxylase [Streptomyces albireticuli]MCD9192450.1 aspartate 1-decarboxylase [Streptomyces albireticuli]PAU50865.1 aspartate 1-decarboxylase [Streptomyces albireticuli]
MLRTFMRSKIHRASITDSNLNYVGSITISPELLDAADIGVHELVHVVNVNNGARFETYTILGAPGANEVIVNGAAARLVQPADKVIIIAYGQLTEDEVKNHKPRVVHVDDSNKIIETHTAA